MLRALTFIAGALVLASCASEESKAIEIDFSFGDQCAWMPPERPDDCASRPPCTYSDADLHIELTALGTYRINANATGWGEVHRPSDRTLMAEAHSIDALALQFPTILEGLEGETTDVSNACVSLDPSQDMTVGDVIAFHDAIAAQGVRKVAFYNELADDWR